MTGSNFTARFYKDALDSARQGVWDYNTATGSKYHSQVWREIRGLGPDMVETLDDDTWIEAIHPDDRDLAREQTRRLNAGSWSRLTTNTANAMSMGTGSGSCAGGGQQPGMPRVGPIGSWEPTLTSRP